MNDKYGKGNWRKGPGSEYNKIKKWAERRNQSGVPNPPKQEKGQQDRKTDVKRKKLPSEENEAAQLQ